MRKRSLDMVYELAKRDDRVLFIGSDLSPGLLGEMKKAYPNRYFMEGIAEANIIGMSAGLGNGRVYSIRQYDCDLHYTPLLRAGGGRSLPARSCRSV